MVADNTGFPRSIQLWDTERGDITTDNILIAYIVAQ